MAVHLPRGEVVRPVGREAEREAQRDFFGPRVLPFWRWQEERAKALLRLAPRLPWPPERGSFSASSPSSPSFFPSSLTSS